MGKITLKKISKNLLDIDASDELLKNFVGIGIEISENGVGQHSVLAIGVEGEYYIFHFASTINLEKIPHSEHKYYVKYVQDLIDPEFSPSFLIHCKKIMKAPAPKYGHIFNQEAIYNAEGIHFADNEITNFATCVGFCINAIRLFVASEKYFEFNDWNSDGMDDFMPEFPNYFDWFYRNFIAENPDVTQEQFDALYKRITPSEYTASAYLTNLPIRKAAVDEIIGNVTRAIKEKIIAA
jgi:hypothetical protein